MENQPPGTTVKSETSNPVADSEIYLYSGNHEDKSTDPKNGLLQRLGQLAIINRISDRFKNRTSEQSESNNNLSSAHADSDQRVEPTNKTLKERQKIAKVIRPFMGRVMVRAQSGANTFGHYGKKGLLGAIKTVKVVDALQKKSKIHMRDESYGERIDDAQLRTNELRLRELARQKMSASEYANFEARAAYEAGRRATLEDSTVQRQPRYTSPYGKHSKNPWRKHSNRQFGR